MAQKSGQGSRPGKKQPVIAKTVTKEQRAPVAPRAPGPNEEDPRVKCRDCGAFGHKASSSRCPMKHWAGALVPQAWGSRKLKENVEPWSQQDQQNPGSLKQAEREKGEGQRQEAQQRVALLQRFPRRTQGGQKPTWKDCTESCGYVRPTPGKPLRMVFTRLDKGCWSSMFLVAPSFHPPVKSGPPGQGRPIVQTSEGRFGHIPLSVLHDDLQVSSSSEDSGRE
ncbi:protein FAM90A1-like [Eumetopias jubatus]|uniref:protein FAM90A1-like n=1 Tax=Eumetopias jubatus TaxID=34886 RepID=UPI001016B3BC|nr:protein FAM90A1-like [Eumetopias jubatus]